MRYAVVIEAAGDNYSAYVPDLPGCVATGSTPAWLKLRQGQTAGTSAAGEDVKRDQSTEETKQSTGVEKVLQAAGRHGPRDRTLLLLGHRHGSESRRSSHCIGTSGISKQASFTFRDS